MQHDRKENRLVDAYGRIIHKLRVQLTDACNFRCFYCMPQNVKFMPSSDLLSSGELVSICAALVELGINEIRVSGGEPTIRKDFNEIIEGLSSLPILKLGVTTNGFFLVEKLDFLQKTRCRHINISLDSLQKERFRAITHTNYFESVYDAIIKAQEMGFHVKVNMVVLRGINDDEIPDFVRFFERYKTEVRFLEYMKIGPSYKSHDRLFVPAKDIITRIEKETKLTPVSVNSDSTSFNFKTQSGGHIGFIASESQSFCRFCSRWRLTATGKLRACLMSEAGVNLRGVPKSQYPELLKSVLEMKPIDRIDHIEQPMYQIGG